MIIVDFISGLFIAIGIFGEGVEGNTVQEAINFRAGRVISAKENWEPAKLT